MMKKREINLYTSEMIPIKSKLLPVDNGSQIRRKSKRSEWFYFKKNSELLLLLLPGAIIILIFAYIPMFGVIVAFKDYRFDLGIWGSKWIGFKNFEFFFVSSDAWRVTRNTVLYQTGYMLITTVTALTFAILLYEVKSKWLKLYQTALFVPYFLSWAVVSYLTLAFLDNHNGFLDKIFVFFGLAPHMWYLEYKPWPYILNVVT